jgi:predicted acetyltransferase
MDGMEFVELVTQVSNVASQRAIEKNGGEIFERFRDHSVHGGAESLRFRIYL